MNQLFGLQHRGDRDLTLNKKKFQAIKHTRSFFL